MDGIALASPGSGRWISALLLLWALAVVSLCSSDGWLRIDYPRWDSSWFYMGGKAWMEGMVPYVDFADSKGPLLWFIYGIGYLISPCSYLGVYLLEILVYWGTFCLIYRSAVVLLGCGGSGALAVVALMPLAYFFPVIHNEMRAEDFCHLLFALTLYSILKIAGESERVWRYGIYGGISMGCGLLIKYNVGIILGIPLVVLLIWKTVKPSKLKGSALRMMGSYVAGFLIPVLPFTLYFLIADNLGAFVKEYFINTLHTMGNIGGNESGAGIGDMLRGCLGGLNLRGLYLVVSCVAPLCSFYRPLRLGSTSWIMVSWFVVAFVATVAVPWDYYLFNLAIFWVFPFAALATHARSIDIGGAVMTGACVLAIITISSTSLFRNGEFYDVKIARQQQRAENQFSELVRSRMDKLGKSVTIAYANMADVGMHIKDGVMPGVTYWALQSGASEEMVDEHIHSILTKHPDFVIIRAEDESIAEKLERNGYVAAMRSEATATSKSAVEEIVVYEMP